MSFNPTKLKEAMADQGLPVSDLPTIGGTDHESLRLYGASAQYNAGLPYDSNQILYGLAYPAVQVTSVAEVSAMGSVGNVKIWPNGLTEAGYLKAGTGIPGAIFITGVGEHIQLGLHALYRNYDKGLRSEEFTYSMPASVEGHPWVVAYSIVTDGETKIEDYEISMELTLNSNGASTPVASWLYNAASNTFEGELSHVTDSFRDDFALQNVTAYDFPAIQPHLLPEAMREAEIPYGLYRITLVATKGEEAVRCDSYFSVFDNGE